MTLLARRLIRSVKKVSACGLIPEMTRQQSTRNMHNPEHDPAPNKGGYCFDLTNEQLEYQRLTRKFAQDVIIPNAAKYDESGEYPQDVFAQAWELGLCNLNIPQSYGGPGLGVLDECIIDEELAYGCPGIFNAITVNNLASKPIVRHGSPYLKEKYVQRLVKEPIQAAYAVSEPNAGSDVAATQTMAVPDGDDWILNGQKMWITNGTVAKWYFVLARTSTDRTTSAGSSFTGFLVDRSWKGVHPGKKLQNMGQRASDTAPVSFDDVRVPRRNVVGQVGAGFKIAMSAFDSTRAVIASGALGAARRAMEEASKYSLERKTMGKPISQHQMVMSMLAEMAINVEVSRLIIHKSAWETDNGRKNTFTVAIAKAFSSEMSLKVCNDALQIFGGNGFNKQYPIEKLLRDCRIFPIYEGTTQIQKLIISRHLLQRAREGFVL